MAEKFIGLWKRYSLLGLWHIPNSIQQAFDCGPYEKGKFWLLAFDPQDGEVAWKKERNYKTPPECDHSYATPTLVKHNGEEAILVWGAERLSVHSAKKW